jgi:hypothetical protein
VTTIKNPDSFERVIPGVPAFAPFEERKVDNATAAELTNGSGLVIVETLSKKARSSSASTD